MSEYDLHDLPTDIEDMGLNNPLELVGLYMQVYNAWVKLTLEVNKRATADIALNRRLAALTPHEGEWEHWLRRADEHLPEWFNHDLVTYPDMNEELRVATIIVLNDEDEPECVYAFKDLQDALRIRHDLDKAVKRYVMGDIPVTYFSQGEKSDTLRQTHLL